ncbi:MAG: hypothetical protein JWO82_204 [Akkermansiaceae bacterium]|nr:hypothetical protein [Akkermansiaceae bacterium]
MNSMTYFAVGWLPWAVAAFVIVALVSGWLFVVRAQSSMPRQLRLLLWLARVAVAGLLLAFILDFRQPTTRQSLEKPMLGVLLDKSASMAVKDAPNGQTRFEAARSHLTREIEPVWGGTDRMQVAFAGTSLTQGDPANVAPADTRSALGKGMSEMLERQNQQPLDGVILLSDGAVSDEGQMLAAAKLYREARVPVYPWLVGSSEQPADLRIASAALKQPSPSQALLHLDLAVDAPGCAGKDTTLTVRFDNQTLLQQQVHLTGKRQTLSIDFNSPYRGLQFYDLELSQTGGETFLDNNHTRLACDLKREPIRVMYMEGSAPYEIKYLREAIEADAEMEIDCMDSLVDDMGGGSIFGGKQKSMVDQAGREISGIRNSIHGYPKTLEGLLQYDVIINSDIEKELFTDAQLKATVDFVEKRGGGFVMVGGHASFGSGGYEKTVIDKLMPVEIGDDLSFLSSSFKPKVTEAGKNHPIMQVGKDAAETEAAWTRYFPGFYGANGAKRAKPGAHVLATTISSYAHDNGSILFAVQQIGKGRTMAFMSDTTESWGASFEKIWGPTGRDSKYYQKFWNNTIRWLAADRIARKGGGAVIGIPETPVTVGDTVNLTIASPSSGDLAGLTMTLKEGDNAEAPLPLRWDAGKKAWEASFIARNPGELRFEAKYANAEGVSVSTKAGLEVRSGSDEAVAVAVRPELMAQVARITGGKVLTDDNAGDVLKEIAARSMPTVWKGSASVWDRWWILIPLLAITGAEWLLRRRRSYGPAPVPAVAAVKA